jgi:hypothetical protein
MNQHGTFHRVQFIVWGRLQQFNVKDQRRVARDRGRGARLAVAELGRDRDRALAAGAHAFDTNAHALDDITDAVTERERLLAVLRCIELLAVGQKALVQDADLAATDGNFHRRLELMMGCSSMETVWSCCPRSRLLGGQESRFFASPARAELRSANVQRTLQKDRRNEDSITLTIKPTAFAICGDSRATAGFTTSACTRAHLPAAPPVNPERSANPERPVLEPALPSAFGLAGQPRVVETALACSGWLKVFMT